MILLLLLIQESSRTNRNGLMKKQNLKIMKPFQVYITIMIAILGLSSSCGKQSFPAQSASIKGQIIDRVLDTPVSFAEVRLMEFDTDQYTNMTFDRWTTIDSMVADSLGRFTFNYEGREVFKYGIYSISERYFDEMKPWIIDVNDTDQDVTILPKAYLKVNMIDEQPYKSFDSLEIKSTVYESNPKIYTWFEDATIVVPFTPDETRVVSIKFWNDGVLEKIDGSTFCNALDTCEFDVTY